MEQPSGYLINDMPPKKNRGHIVCVIRFSLAEFQTSFQFSLRSSIRVSHFSFLLMKMLQRAKMAKERMNINVDGIFEKRASAVPIIVIRLIICSDVISVA